MNSPIIVAGMHRSGTSFVASVLQALGVNVGDETLAPDANNRRGYFEDVDFLDLQRRMLRAACAEDDGGHPDWGWTENNTLDPAGFAAFTGEAKRLVADRSQGGGQWGWKDPRTTLLLDFWDALVPEARYVFVYRFPWDVVDSMQRLGADVFLANPSYAYHIWTFYNSCLHRFATMHPDRCLVVSVNALIADPDEITRQFKRKFGDGPPGAPLEPLADTSELKTISGSDPLIGLTSVVWPECTALLSRLDEIADLSSEGLWSPSFKRSRLLRPDEEPPEGHTIELSVVTPTYDQGTLLVEAVASVERNAVPGTELIIVNDGTGDERSLEILQALKHCGYFVIDQTNAGLSFARNAAVERARGRFILPLDDDNRVLPGFLQAAITILDAHPNVGVVYGDRSEFGKHNDVVEVPEFDLDSLLQENYIDACAVYRKEMWVDCGGYDPAASPFEDWELWINAASRGWGFSRVPYPAFEYRVRPGSLISLVDDPRYSSKVRAAIQSKHGALYSASWTHRAERALADVAAAEAELSRREAALESVSAELDARRLELEALAASLDSRSTQLGAVLDDQVREIAEFRHSRVFQLAETWRSGRPLVVRSWQVARLLSGLALRRSRPSVEQPIHVDGADADAAT